MLYIHDVSLYVKVMIQFKGKQRVDYSEDGWDGSIALDIASKLGGVLSVSSISFHQDSLTLVKAL